MRSQMLSGNSHCGADESPSSSRWSDTLRLRRDRNTVSCGFNLDKRRYRQKKDKLKIFHGVMLSRFSFKEHQNGLSICNTLT